MNTLQIQESRATGIGQVAQTALFRHYLWKVRPLVMHVSIDTTLSSTSTASRSDAMISRPFAVVRDDLAFRTPFLPALLRDCFWRGVVVTITVLRRAPDPVGPNSRTRHRRSLPFAEVAHTRAARCARPPAAAHRRRGWTNATPKLPPNRHRIGLDLGRVRVVIEWS
jgi:hypothetical protein